MTPSGYTKQLHKILKDAGCKLLRQGRKHELWESPITGLKFTVPRNCKSRFTANGILKDAGIPRKF